MIFQVIYTMVEKSLTKKQTSFESQYSKILDEVPYECGFRFCTGVGNYTGITAISLSDFAEKLEKVDANSVEFHFRRNDFQNWVKDVLCDEELSEKIRSINKELSVEELRSELLGVVNSRINHLKTFHWTSGSN
jgi:hypothetical protein